MDNLLTTHEAAKLLRLSAQTLSTWRCRGEGPRFVRLGGNRVAYREADLAAFVEANVTTSTSA